MGSITVVIAVWTFSGMMRLIRPCTPRAVRSRTVGGRSTCARQWATSRRAHSS